MHFPHNVSLVRMCVYVPHNDQLGRTDFPHNALSPQCISCTYMCVLSPQRPTRTHRFSPQCTFPTKYHLYVCVCTFPSTTNCDAQIFATMHFPHNVSLVRIGVCVCYRKIHTLIGHRAEISSAQFNWDCSLIATGSMDKTVKLWDTASGVLYFSRPLSLSSSYSLYHHSSLP